RAPVRCRDPFRRSGFARDGNWASRWNDRVSRVFSTQVSCARSRSAPARLVAGPQTWLARLAARSFLDGVHTVGIESDVFLDRGDRGIGRLIGPDGVDRTLAPQRDAVVGAVTLVRAVGGVVRPLEQRGVHVLAWNILDRRVARFAKCQCRPRISDSTSRDDNDHAMRIPLDRDRMVWPRGLDGLRFPVGMFRHGLLLQSRVWWPARSNVMDCHASRNSEVCRTNSSGY